MNRNEQLMAGIDHAHFLLERMGKDFATVQERLHGLEVAAEMGEWEDIRGHLQHLVLYENHGPPRRAHARPACHQKRGGVTWTTVTTGTSPSYKE